MKPTTETLKAQFQPKESQVLKIDRQLCVARFSPNGEMIAAGGFDGKVRRWDLTGEKAVELPVWDTKGGWVQDLAFHPTDPKLFTVDSWGALQAWSLSGKTPKSIWSHQQAHQGWIHSLAITKDGSLLGTTGIDGKVHVWSTTDGKLRRTFSEHQAEAFAVAFHPDGKSIVSGDLLGRVLIRDVASGKVIRELDAKILFKGHRLQQVGGVRVLAFDGTGTRLFVAHHRSGGL